MPEERRVSRRRSQSNHQVSFTEPIVIKHTSSQRFEVLLQYIQRSSGDVIAPKFIFYKKKDGEIFFPFPAEFTLNHEEAKDLKRVLEEGLAVAEAAEDGDFLILRLNGTDTNLDGQNPAAVGQAILPLLADGRILQALQSSDDGSALLHGVQANVRLNDLSSAIEELRSNLDDNVTNEQVYQEWCERHHWAFGNIYTMRDTVRQIALGDSVDGLLTQTANGFRDIFELKRPNMDPIGWDDTHRSFFWSREAAMAIGQCHRYLDALHEAAANGLRDHPEVLAYHPRAVIVIGRSSEWEPGRMRALHGLNARLHGVSIMTYDQLLAQAEQLLKTLRG